MVLPRMIKDIAFFHQGVPKKCSGYGKTTSKKGDNLSKIVFLVLKFRQTIHRNNRKIWHDVKDCN